MGSASGLLLRAGRLPAWCLRYPSSHMGDEVPLLQSCLLLTNKDVQIPKRWLMSHGFLHSGGSAHLCSVSPLCPALGRHALTVPTTLGISQMLLPVR